MIQFLTARREDDGSWYNVIVDDSVDFEIDKPYVYRDLTDDEDTHWDTHTCRRHISYNEDVFTRIPIIVII